MKLQRILSVLLMVVLGLALAFSLTGCPDDDEDDADGGGDADGDTDSTGECDFETYCGHYIGCGWYADQDYCTETTQPWIDDCVGSIADWIDCSCECFGTFDCSEATELDDCLSGCYAANCM